MIYQDDNILAWNYDKGREIGIKMFEDDGTYYSAQHIITSLLHELAHSISDKVGHGTEWKTNYNYLLRFKDKYVAILIKKTVL